MHTWKAVLSLITLSTAASAGPTLACHPWISSPGSVFELITPLRDAAMSVANHPAERPAALQKMAVLKSQIRPGNAASLLKAGYWIAILNVLRVTPESDGPELIRQAAELRPDDPEYHFFVALAYFDTDKEEYRKHWMRARELAKPGTAVSANLKAFEPELLARMR